MQASDEAAAQLFYFGEGVRFAALIHNNNRSSLLDLERVRFEVPAGIGRSRSGFCEKVGDLLDAILAKESFNFQVFAFGSKGHGVLAVVGLGVQVCAVRKESFENFQMAIGGCR